MWAASFFYYTLGNTAATTCTLSNGKQEATSSVQGVLKEFSDVFSEPKTLPPLRENHNHPVILKEGADLVNLRPYRHPSIQEDEIEKQVKGLLESGVIRESSSPFASPIALVKKKDGSWRMCIDYQELNKLTVKNKYPIPLVDELLDELKDARWFTKQD